ncbi:MAG TPA: hypothetical protein VM639_00865 [Dongiaceae bacterium]|nr:hypothetical protein [Dongiaceae bacterium]
MTELFKAISEFGTEILKSKVFSGVLFVSSALAILMLIAFPAFDTADPNRIYLFALSLVLLFSGVAFITLSAISVINCLRELRERRQKEKEALAYLTRLTQRESQCIAMITLGGRRIFEFDEEPEPIRNLIRFGLLEYYSSQALEVPKFVWVELEKRRGEYSKMSLPDWPLWRSPRI